MKGLTTEKFSSFILFIKQYNKIVILDSITQGNSVGIALSPGNIVLSGDGVDVPGYAQEGTLRIGCCKIDLESIC